MYVLSTGPWYLGALVPWSLGTLEPWYLGALVPWSLGTLEPWYLGALVPWSLGTWPWNTANIL
jgi:hypothetical protein